MWKSLFDYCLACGIDLPRDTPDLYCDSHQQSARRALARMAWGTAIIPRLVLLLIIFGILFATSH
jgi:hypothetical protein